MEKEVELYELPEWVKLVNRIIRGEKTLEDERPAIKRGISSEKA
jgi:hypothetical protein